MNLLYHTHYVFLGILLVFDFCIISSPTFVPRLGIALGLACSFFIAYIRRFTIPSMPIFTWLATFYAYQFIPSYYRPTHIYVNLLPALERILYGTNLSQVISAHTHPAIDILAWIPYGIFHFLLPFVLALVLFIVGPPGCLKVYATSFGYMNLVGVLTQFLFPNASPWYEINYGFSPADYTITGEPGGLARIDQILGLNLYGTTFGSSPLVFGAFPSLHSGSATIEMLFLVYVFPKLRPLAVFYIAWMWFSAMYLTHHYMIDLVAGSIYAVITFSFARVFLPKISQNFRHHYLGVPFSLDSLLYSIEYETQMKKAECL